MKKGLFSLLGLVAFVAIALMPATSFAAPSTRTAQSHKIHIFPSRGHAQPSKAASTTTSFSSGYPQLNLTYHGGPVMTDMTNVYAIFWEPTGNVSANYNSLIERFLVDFADGTLYSVARHYPQTDGRFPGNTVLAGTWVDSTAYVRSSLWDSDIQGSVTRAQRANGWTSGLNNLFIVFTERNETLPSTCGYHSSFGTNTIYAAVPYAASLICRTTSSPNSDDADSTINVLSYIEMDSVTDPLGNAWYRSSNGLKIEVNGACTQVFGPVNSQGADVVWNNHPYFVQSDWDNSTSSCVLSPIPSTGILSYYKIVNRNSALELDMSGGSDNAGAQAIQWTDHNGPSQQWLLLPDGPYYQIVNRDSGLVLDVSGGSTGAGAHIIQWTNHNGTNQQWALKPQGGYQEFLNVNSGLALDISGGSTSIGASAVQAQWENGTGVSQQWSLVPETTVYYKIQNLNSGLVMDVSGGGTNAGAHVIQWPYHAGTNQQWALVPDGSYYQIVNLHSGLVMDVSGASTSAGAQVIQWTNHNGTNQQWSVLTDGAYVQIVNRNSHLVLDVFGASKSGGANVIQWTNHNGFNQQWSLIATSA